MNNRKILYHDRIDVFGDADVNKTSESKECNVFHYWYFINKGFKFQPDACNGYQDALLMYMNLNDIAIFNDIAILNVRGIDYCYIINGISKSEAMGV